MSIPEDKEAIGADFRPRTGASRRPSLSLVLIIFASIGTLVQLASIGRIAESLSAGLPQDARGLRSPFNWQQCENHGPNWLCGYLDVPLDYSNASDSRTARIATVLYRPNPKRKSNRTIVINPGGPGGSGTRYAFTSGERISNYTLQDKADAFDVLGFDPRGVNMSTPTLDCYNGTAYRDRWTSLRNQGISSTTDLASHLVIADAAFDADLQACRHLLQDSVRFMTTAFVARDVDRIREALGEEELTSYFVSYGTGLGQTYSQLFPHRVGRMILDALEFVVDQRKADGFATASVFDVNATFSDGFVGECVAAGPEHCALASKLDGSGVETRDSLYQRLLALLADLAAKPRAGLDSHGKPNLFRVEDAKGMLYEALYSPSSWDGTARMLAELQKGNVTGVMDFVSKGFSYQPPKAASAHVAGHQGVELLRRRPKSKPGSPWKPFQAGDSGELLYAVVCGDSYDDEHRDLGYWQSLWERLDQATFLSSDSRFFEVLACRTYDWKSAEVYRGEFNHTLANPLLLIGGTYDPATPIRNGLRLLSALGDANARLIRHHGYGHSSSADKSRCTESLKRSYLLHGEVPEASVTECFADQKPYRYHDEGDGKGKVSRDAGRGAMRGAAQTLWESRVERMGSRGRRSL